MFRELVGLPQRLTGHEAAPGQDRSAVPLLADHIARRFEGRGEPRDDLIQVAAMGWTTPRSLRREDRSDFVSRGSYHHGQVRRQFRDNKGRSRFPGVLNRICG